VADPLGNSGGEGPLRPVTFWFEVVESLLRAQAEFLRLSAADWRVPPHMRAAAAQTEEFLDQWARSQRAAFLDSLAAFSGYRNRDPRTPWQGAGAEMAASLQDAARRLVDAQAAWGRSWNADNGDAASEQCPAEPASGGAGAVPYAASERTGPNNGASSPARRRTDRRA
jgi:hypothetical protein